MLTRIQCDQCFHLFPDEDSRQGHVKAIHEEKNDVRICPHLDCAYTALTFMAIHQHCIHVHGSDLEFRISLRHPERIAPNSSNPRAEVISASRFLPMPKDFSSGPSGRLPRVVYRMNGPISTPLNIIAANLVKRSETDATYVNMDLDNEESRETTSSSQQENGSDFPKIEKTCLKGQAPLRVTNGRMANVFHRSDQPVRLGSPSTSHIQHEALHTSSNPNSLKESGNFGFQWNNGVMPVVKQEMDLDPSEVGQSVPSSRPKDPRKRPSTTTTTTDCKRPATPRTAVSLMKLLADLEKQSQAEKLPLPPFPPLRVIDGAKPRKTITSSAFGAPMPNRMPSVRIPFDIPIGSLPPLDPRILTFNASNVSFSRF